MTFIEQGQDGIETGTSQESVSRSELIDSIYGFDPEAEEETRTPEGSGNNMESQDEVEEPEKTESESESDQVDNADESTDTESEESDETGENEETADEILARLREKEARLDEKLKEADSFFTKEAEKLAQIRKEQGLDEAYKEDRKESKGLEKAGEKPSAEFLAKSYITDDNLAEMQKRGFITTEQGKYLKSMERPLNALFNMVALNAHRATAAAIEELKGVVKPVVDDAGANKQMVERAKVWRGHLDSYPKKFGEMTDAQKQAIAIELNTDKELQALVDTADEAKVHKAIRRIIHDPELIRAVAASKTKDTGESKKASKKTDKRTRVVETRPEPVEEKKKGRLDGLLDWAGF